MKRQRGQALVLVLILLALGSLLIVPVLQITGNTLKASLMYTGFTNEDYAADAVLEYGLWRLNYEPGYAASLPIGEKSPPFYITVNGVTANASVTPQATSSNGTVEQLGGQTLMQVDGDPVYYKVTKTVTPNTADVGANTTFTYTVSIRSYDPTTNTTHKLTRIRDHLSYQFGYTEGYVNNSASWNATNWGVAPFNPQKDWRNDDEDYPYWRLTWDFGGGGIPFEYGEVKTMSFQVRGALAEGYWGNDVNIRPPDNDQINPFLAPIKVGNPTTNVPFSFVSINKTTDTDILYPNIAANLTYTVTAINTDIVPMSIRKLIDWLPSTGFADPAFTYIGNSTTAFITHTDNTTLDIPMPDTYSGYNDILSTQWKGLPYMRWELEWDFREHADARFDPIILGVGEKLTVIFRVTVTPRASGLYLNEFYFDCERYPANVTTSPKFENMHPPNSNYTYNVTVNMTNPDIYFTEYDRFNVWLPSDDSGNQSKAFSYNSSYTPTYVIKDTNNNTRASGTANNPSISWDSKKKRYSLEWQVQDSWGGGQGHLHLAPGETVIWTFRIRSPSNPSTNYNELVWRINFREPDGINYDRSIYSYPIAGVMVPMYDIEAQTLNSILMANAWLGNLSTIHTKSAHWKNHH
ncbi:MAG: hypothetical protein Q7J73_04850 [Dehalococcoidales bacterium]|nr:hypothetical protein [Dehalococcoidales bacterium]